MKKAGMRLSGAISDYDRKLVAGAARKNLGLGTMSDFDFNRMSNSKPDWKTIQTPKTGKNPRDRRTTTNTGF